MTKISGADREQQRFEHLVLGRARPKVEAPPPPARKKRSRRVIVRAAPPVKTVTLAPGIEERVAMRERWSHKNGTAETHEHVFQERMRPGSIARLYESGALDEDQLAAAEQIAETFRAITAAVTVRTASLEARIDGSAHGRAEEEQLGRVSSEIVYSQWRASIGRCAQALLPVIVHDVGLTIVAREHRISMPRARRLLAAALDLWWQTRGTVRRASNP